MAICELNFKFNIGLFSMWYNLIVNLIEEKRTDN